MNTRAIAVAVLISGAALYGACSVGDAPSATQVNCIGYCNKMMATCQGDNAVFKDNESCQATCSHFDTGTTNDTTGDTLGCRNNKLVEAADAPPSQLKSACLAAAGVSSCAPTLCDAFCKLDLAACADTPPYASLDECKTACAAFPQDFSQTFLGATGDTLECRAYHLQIAAVPANSKIHCPHTGKVSAVCNNASQDGGTSDAGGGDAGASDAAGE